MSDKNAFLTGDAVRVDWLDACLHVTEMPDDGGYECEELHTYGVVLDCNDERIVVAQTIPTDAEMSPRGAMCIPRGCIKAVWIQKPYHSETVKEA